MEKLIKSIAQIIKDSRHAVFFGGAGVSTDCGIPDFRGNGGLYKNGGAGNEYLLSRECLDTEPERFFEFYRENMIFDGVSPCEAHNSLARLEERGIIKSVITQNIDGLHQAAGSKNVIELHGKSRAAYCMKCKTEHGVERISGAVGVPLCPVCGGVIRPDVTLYGERLDGMAFREAAYEMESADVLIVGGTSLTVNPAASLVEYFTGKHFIIVNKDKTPYDSYAEYVIRRPITEFFEEVEKHIG